MIYSVRLKPSRASKIRAKLAAEIIVIHSASVICINRGSSNVLKVLLLLSGKSAYNAPANSNKSTLINCVAKLIIYRPENIEIDPADKICQPEKIPKILTSKDI
jgi:hypothetical protein